MTEPFNAAGYLTERRVLAGDGDRVALRHPRGRHTYTELTAEVRRVAGGLAALGVRPEERVLLCMADDVELATGILAAMYLGAVAVPCSSMLTGGELAKLVIDSRARVLLGSAQFAPAITAAAADAPDLGHVVLTGDEAPDVPAISGLTWVQLRDAEPAAGPYPTWDESPALWLYTSGTTGTPKGAMHRHIDIRHVAETYGMQVLGIGPDDVCLSGAKLFFAYGIGNSLFFPLSVGRERGAGAVAAEPAAVRRPDPRAPGHAVLRRTQLLGAADGRRPAAGDVRQHPQRGLGRRGAAGPDVPRGPRPVRLRDPRRHRLHRGAAHLHLQHRREGGARAARASRCRGTRCSCAGTTAASSRGPASRACSTWPASRSAPGTGAAPR